jgi:hypothetical protein
LNFDLLASLNSSRFYRALCRVNTLMCRMVLVSISLQ